MCGIAGLIDQTLSRGESEHILQKMLQISHHRGPDAQGAWMHAFLGLGHNRLSIIDLSEAANQPMHFTTRRGTKLSIVFNGEIYNYIEIRTELTTSGYVFSTQSDTEVILAAYDYWGDACIEKFIGMWAFALWDDEKQRLFCSRDRFGIKPFHYCSDGARLYFASEIKSLKCTPLFRSTVNSQQVARGLYLGWMHYRDETYWASVKTLPAAHNLVWEKNSIRIWQYWDIDLTKERGGSFEEKCHDYRELFLDSIRLTNRRDVTLGVCLSGGLDSSAIASALSVLSSGAELKTFSAFYDGAGDVDERPFIRHVIDKYPNIHPFYISPTQDDVAAHIDNIVWHMDAPMPSSSYISHYFVMKLASENGIKVTLDGQGSDETLGGYLHSVTRLLADDYASGQYGRALQTLAAHKRRHGISFQSMLKFFGISVLAVFQDENSMAHTEMQRVFPWILRQKYSNKLFTLPEKQGARLEQQLYHLTFTTLLPTLLHTEDINAMAFSIESRVPFLDHRLVELGFALNEDDKIHRAETKYILRKSLHDILPREIAERKDKKGFVTPGEVKWLRGKLSFLLDGNFAEIDEFVDVPALQQHIRDFRNGKNTYARYLWRVAMLRAWMKNSRTV